MKTRKLLLFSARFAFVVCLALLLFPSLFGAEYAFSKVGEAQEISPHVEDEILIRFRSGKMEDQKSALLKQNNATVKKELPGLGVKVLHVPAEALPHILSAFRASPLVEYAEPNYILATQETVPNDPDYTRQWGLAAIGASDAWDIQTGNADIIIGLIDTGVDLDHPDLQGKISAGWDFVNNDGDPQDDNGHGTHVAGIMAATANNGIGITGVSWGARIMPVKVLDASGSGSYADVAAGILYAVDHGAKVINLSLGGTSPSITLEEAVNYAADHGVVMVASAGNRGTTGVTYPAKYPNTIAVGAVDSNMSLASFSSQGPEVDLVAPGIDIYSTLLDNSYGLKNGTSMAAPFVSGAAALLLSANGANTNNEIVAALENSTQDLGSPGLEIAFGFGLIQVDKALIYDNGSPTPDGTPTPPVPGGTPTPTPGTSTPIPPDNWKSYMEDQYKIEIQYPETWSIYLDTTIGRYPGFNPVMLTSFTLPSDNPGRGLYVPPGEAALLIAFEGNDLSQSQTLEDYAREKLISPYHQLTGAKFDLGNYEAVEMEGETEKIIVFARGENVYSVLVYKENDPIQNNLVNGILDRLAPLQDIAVDTPDNFTPLKGSEEGIANPITVRPGLEAISYNGPTLEMPWDNDEQYTFNSGPHSFPIDWSCSAIRNISGMNGLDFGLTEDEVLAAAEGTVSGKGYDSSYGNYVNVDHGDGWGTAYWHLKSIDALISMGISVAQGTVLGISGTNSGSQHLHIQLLPRNGQPVSWEGSFLDGYLVRSFELTSDYTKGFNYQGTLTRGAETVLTQPYCGQQIHKWLGSGDGNGPGTIEAGDGQFVRSTNQKVFLAVGNIGGLVKDSANGSGISSVTVTLTRGSYTQSTSTDSSGRYQFNNIPAGSVTISASKAGYTSNSISATVIGYSSIAAPDIFLTQIACVGEAAIGSDIQAALDCTTPTPTPTPPPGVIDGLRLISISNPTVLKGQTFGVSVTYEIVSGSLIKNNGDHLHALNESNTFGAWPVQELSGNYYAGQRVTFSFNMIAPNSNGTYESDWQMRVGGNHIGPVAAFRFTVQDEPQPPGGGEAGVYIYDNTNYSSGGGYYAGPLWEDYSYVGDFWNDNIESLRTSGCYGVVLYQDSNFSGNHMTTNGTTDLGSWRNIASSIRVRSCDNAAFTLYGMGDFNGESWASDRTIYDLGHWEKNDWAESMRVYSGKGIVACEHGNFHGSCGRATGPANFADINALAQGLRHGVSSIRVCDGPCPQPPTPPTIFYPENGSKVASNHDVILYWGGDGWEYYAELSGGGISGTRTFGWSSNNQWNAGQLPESASPYTWRVMGWNGFGEGGWVSGSFYVRPPTVQIIGVFTTDELGAAEESTGEPYLQMDEVNSSALKNTFNSGDPIQLYLDTLNDFDIDTVATLTWEVLDPAGRLVDNLSYTGDLSSPPGRSWWHLDANIPSDAITGDYTFTGSIIYNSQTTSFSTNFYVNGVTTVEVVGVFTTDEIGANSSTDTGPQMQKALVTSADSKTDFNIGDPIRLYIDTYNSFPVETSATFKWEVLDPAGRPISSLSYTGDLPSPAGRSWWYLSSAIPADALTGDYTFNGWVTYNGQTTGYFTTFHVSGVETIIAVEAWTTDENGTASSAELKPGKAEPVSASAYKTAFNAGDPIRLFLNTYSSVSVISTASYVFQVFDPVGRLVPELFYSGDLETDPGTTWWYLPATIPAGALTGEYQFIGSITYLGETTKVNSYISVTGPQTVEVLSVFLTDENGTATSTGTGPRQQPGKVSASAIKTSFNYGEPIQLYIDTYNNVPPDATATFQWRVTDAWGRAIPELSWSGDLTTPAGWVWWYLDTDIPEDAITGEYTFTGSITYNGQISSQSTIFHIEGSPIPDPIFSDGFESGNLSAWSTAVSDGGDLSASAAAALVEAQGLQAVIDDNNAVYLTDLSPEAEPRYRARFYFDPNSIGMANNDRHLIFTGYQGASTMLVQLELRFYGGTYYLRAYALDDTAVWRYTGWIPIADATQAVEIDWQAGSAPGANDGHLTLWIDGLQKTSLAALDNDTRRIDQVRLGAISGIDAGTRGAYYFDAFASRRVSYVGPAFITAAFSAAPTTGKLPLVVSFTNLTQPADPANTYLWDFGDGSTSTEAAPTHTYTAYGDFTVTLTATGPLGTDSEVKTALIHIPETIFSDGFESGNLSAWSTAVTDGGDLSASAAAALVEAQGLQAVIDDNNAIYLTDLSPEAEPRYRARFYFDPNSIGMANNDRHLIFTGYQGASTMLVQLELRFYGGTYYLRAYALDDTAVWRYTGWIPIADAAQAVEIDWQAGSAPGANDGHLTLWIDGLQKTSLAALDNDTRRIDQVRLGAISGIDAGTRGAYYFDAFASRRLSSIGL